MVDRPFAVAFPPPLATARINPDSSSEESDRMTVDRDEPVARTSLSIPGHAFDPSTLTYVARAYAVHFSAMLNGSSRMSRSHSKRSSGGVTHVVRSFRGPFLAVMRGSGYGCAAARQ